MRHLVRTAPLAAIAAVCALTVPLTVPLLGPAPAWAQPAPAGHPPMGPSAAMPPGQGDPVVARVDGSDIRMSDVMEAMQGVPPEYRSMPQQMLMPMLIDQLIDRKAVVRLALKQGLDKDPAVQRMMARAADEALQSALVQRTVGPAVTEDAVRARYDRDIAGKPGEPEVHARHILVANEADAVAIIAELKRGGDFAAIAKARSTDPGAAQGGGDLGWFKRSDMLPPFSDAAFALKPGEITDKPVQTQFGWHVIQVEERRVAPTPTFDQAREELRSRMIQESVQKLLASARSAVKVERFNPDGSVQRPTDNAMPPPAPAR
jgi:peptidyl-prolyl cis-trans isomerase C